MYCVISPIHNCTVAMINALRFCVCMYVPVIAVTLLNVYRVLKHLVEKVCPLPLPLQLCS